MGGGAVERRHCWAVFEFLSIPEQLGELSAINTSCAYFKADPSDKDESGKVTTDLHLSKTGKRVHVADESQQNLSPFALTIDSVDGTNRAHQGMLDAEHRRFQEEGSGHLIINPGPKPASMRDQHPNLISTSQSQNSHMPRERGAKSTEAKVSSSNQHKSSLSWDRGSQSRSNSDLMLNQHYSRNFTSQHREQAQHRLLGDDPSPIHLALPKSLDGANFDEMDHSVRVDTTVLGGDTNNSDESDFERFGPSASMAIQDKLKIESSSDELKVGNKTRTDEARQTKIEKSSNGEAIAADVCNFKTAGINVGTPFLGRRHQQEGLAKVDGQLLEKDLKDLRSNDFSLSLQDSDDTLLGSGGDTEADSLPVLTTLV